MQSGLYMPESRKKKKKKSVLLNGSLFIQKLLGGATWGKETGAGVLVTLFSYVGCRALLLYAPSYDYGLTGNKKMHGQGDE